MARNQLRLLQETRAAHDIVDRAAQAGIDAQVLQEKLLNKKHSVCGETRDLKNMLIKELHSEN